MKNKIINFIVLLFLATTTIITIVTLNKTKGLEKLIVFGQEIEVKEGKQVYFIKMKNAKVKSVNNGCENPIQIEYNNGKTKWNGGQYLVDGEKEAYFKINYVDDKEEISNEVTYAYDLYVHVYLEEPLEIECQNRVE